MIYYKTIIKPHQLCSYRMLCNGTLLPGKSKLLAYFLELHPPWAAVLTAD